MKLDTPHIIYMMVTMSPVPTLLRYRHFLVEFAHFALPLISKLFIIIVKIASVLHLVICLVLVGPSSPSKLKLYGAIS